MIKRMKIDGRDATVAFFDDEMNPTSEENATEAEINPRGPYLSDI